ncbi:MAG: hypothetical protein OSA99_01185 [Acidimicrobiales bacterium]|nr:hypothetical protein [Acidimicrobiales bacterium]
MPDLPRLRRVLAALGALIVVAAVVAPGSIARAQSDEDLGPWDGSSFPDVTKRTPTFELTGQFEKEADDRLIDEEIESVRVVFDDTPELPDGCTVPDPIVDNGNGERSASTDPAQLTYSFTVPDDHEWLCNGRYRATATATTNRFADPQAIEATITVAIPPVPVGGVGASAAGDPDPETGATEDDPETVTVTWQRVADEDIVEGQGYRVQRAGPGGDAAFETIGDVIAQDDVPEDGGSFDDVVAVPGEYRYRVQTLRQGPDGPDGAPVPSPAADTPTAAVEVAGPPPPPTSTPGVTAPPTTRALQLPSVGPGTDNPRATPPTISVPSPPTTLDTGFNDELDYGDRDIPEPGEELAGQGQSVIETPSEGAGLLGPVAGAMVLLGWAGHVAYLNRLAKQF